MNRNFPQLPQWLGSSRVLNTISRSSDVILAFFVIIIIMMIIIPVPSVVIDTLIAINLTVSLCLLMVSLYISKAVHLSVFPSILLITTLFRLGIEIAATKHILLYASAGDIIYAFGNVVVSGSYVVGGVVFLIITIVQFIVVTKGAERVAEVAARFTLDAMPGKQMSIDADMRSGIIDSNQARQLRLSIQKESQLYGAMDGAMKFVKGDVIAGIVIAVINIVCGLIIGVGFHHMSASLAAKTYTLLSIGSGLVSQVPSLLISLTAGIVTTRVSSDSDEANLGSDISLQVLAQPKGLIIAACITFVIAFIRAFPTFLFLAITALLLSLGIYGILKQKKKKEGKDAETIVETGPDGKTIIRSSKDDYSLTLPVMLEVGSYIAELIKKDREGGKFIEEKIPKMSLAIYQDLGIKIPGLYVKTDSPLLARAEYIIHLNEVPISRGQIIPDHVLTNETEKNLNRLNIPCVKIKNIINQETCWVDKKYMPILDKAAIKYWKILDVLLLQVSYFYKQHASDFIGIQETRSLLEFVEKSFPDLVKEVTRLLPLQKITEIFRRLVQEQVPIRDLRTILEGLVEWAQSEKDPIMLTELARSTLKLSISYACSRGQNILPVYLLDPEIEDIVRGSIKQTSSGSYLALDPDSVQLILQAFRNTVRSDSHWRSRPIILTTMDVRRFVKKLIESEFPNYVVISHQEVIPQIRIQPLGKIQLT